MRDYLLLKYNELLEKRDEINIYLRKRLDSRKLVNNEKHPSRLWDNLEGRVKFVTSQLPLMSTLVIPDCAATVVAPLERSSRERRGRSICKKDDYLN